MTSKYKKFFHALVTVALGAMRNGAMADDTNYNFSYSGDKGYSIVDGVFVVNNSGVITGISGTVIASNSYNGVIAGLLSKNVLGKNDNKYFPAGPYLNYFGVSFGTSGGNLNFYYIGPGYALYDNNNKDISNGSMTSSLAAVPEIDGALIPQVGFLLACLFLMLGRRKENTEAMLSA